MTNIIPFSASVVLKDVINYSTYFSRHFTYIFFFSTVFVSTKLGAQTTISNASNDSILIRDVILISQEDTIGLNSSLIIVNKKLELVTTDVVHPNNSTTVYDGNGGYLMGRIIIGKPPSFVVLSENPRNNFDIFLNTKDYVILAMENGEIIINKLQKVNLEEEEKNNDKRLTWSAYSPPLMAVPFNYYSSRKWNKFNTKFISGLFNGIIALDRMLWTGQDENNEAQIGKLEASSLGEIRAIRFGLIGTFNFKRPWIYTAFITNNTFDRDYIDGKKSFTLYDLRLDIPLFADITMSVGKQKEPISMSRLTTLVFLPMQERQAAEDAFLPARNYGVLFNRSYLKQRGTIAAGVFKNFIDSDTTFNETASQVTGRITGLPYLSKDGSNLIHLGMALRYSDAKQPVVAKTESEFYLSPIFVETAVLQPNEFITYDFELYWRKGPFLLGGEYIGNNLSSETMGNPSVYGYNIVGNWAVTGEMRPYRKRSGIFDPLPVSKSVGQGGSGAFELSLRYSLIDLNDGYVQGGIMRTASAGVNWWPSARVQIGCNYRIISLDRLSVIGISSGVNVRLMMILD